MLDQLNQEINRAFDLEEEGRFEEAISLCRKCAQEFPEHQSEIEIEIAKMNYRNGKEEAALLQLLQLYDKTGDQEIPEFVLEVFYYSYQEEYDRQYRENCRSLGNYAYFYGETADLEHLRYYPIYTGEQNIWYYDSTEDRFGVIRRSRMSVENIMDNVYISDDLLWREDILKLEKHSRKQNPFMDMENPLLLVYRRETWELLLQILDLKELLDFDRIVFYESADWLETSFLQDGIAFPGLYLLQNDTGKIKETVENIYGVYEEEYARYQREALEYYRKNKEEIIERIKAGTPRILFLTSRFTTALQYHAKACKRAADRMHLETDLIIGKDRLGRGDGILIRQRKIACFKPDIFFAIDHFRFEFSLFEGMDNLVYVCWIQDPLPYIMDTQSPAKLGKRDIILNHCTTWKKFLEVGYDKRRMLDAPIPADSHIYKKYSLSQEEREKYECDICFVCHASDVDAWIEESAKAWGFSEDETFLLYELCKGYQRLVYEIGKPFYGEDEFQQYVRGALGQNGVCVGEEGEGIKIIAEEMYLWLNQRVYRQALVDWLLDAGYTNIKLWGNGWQTDPKYAPYAMGPARNGETLSKIYQASKIVVGNNVMCTAAARAWESMLSGAFYMSNYVPQEVDVTDIRKIMREGEELVMFYDREDFLQKVEYCLTHEAERLRMAEIGHKAALERMTFDKLMQTMIREIPERISQLEQEES